MQTDCAFRNVSLYLAFSRVTFNQRYMMFSCRCLDRGDPIIQRSKTNAFAPDALFRDAVDWQSCDTKGPIPNIDCGINLKDGTSLD